ncbi:hypothetical protein D3C86_810530 [compost metagenome]
MSVFTACEDVTLELFERCRSLSSLAIVGTAKNVGKTTTMNWLIERFEARGIRLGLTSVGRDGEDLDMVTDRPKPRITPPPGTLVATAHLSAKRSSARLKEVRPTPFRTAIGPVSIYEVQTMGTVEVAGPVSMGDTRRLVEMLRELGAKQVIVDGAIDRRASAASDLAEGVILATGLALSEDPEEVVRRTAAHVRWLQLPSAPFAVPQEAGALLSTAAGVSEDNFRPWPGKSLLEQGDELARWLPAEAEALVLPGAFTEAMARGLMKRIAEAPRALAVVVPDGTHVLMDPEAFEALEARGVKVYASRPIQLVAVTVNPTSPQGASTDPARFRARMEAELGTLPVYDLVLEQARAGASGLIDGLARQ